MLLTIPLALKVSRGLAPNYENPYGLMAIMGANVQLHLRAGLLLLGGLRHRADRRRRGTDREPVHRLSGPAGGGRRGRRQR